VAVERSRTAHPIGEEPRGLTMGSWGMWLTITALTTAVAGFAAAGLYLHTGQEAWPPEGITRPGVGEAVVSVLLALAGAAIAHRARAQVRTGDYQPASLGMIAGIGLLLGSVLVLARDLTEAGFRWDEHAYTSLYWVLTVLAATFVGIGLLMLASVLVQRLVGAVDESRMLELDVTVGYLWWAAGAAAALLAVVHLLPDPAAEGVAAAVVGVFA
jgi:cytochrome c oxidase subunit III